VIGNGHAGFGRAASEKDPQGHLADVVPRPASTQRSAKHSPSARTASHQRRSRSPGQPNGDCTAPGPACKPAPNAARSSLSPPPASSPGSAGRSPKSSNPTHTPSAGSVAARHARGTREVAMSNPPHPGLATPDPRQRLPTTNHGPAVPTREYQPDRASRTANRTATHPADHNTHPQARPARNHRARIDKRLSISATGGAGGLACRPWKAQRRPKALTL
jgi:hypothetical protein